MVAKWSYIASDSISDIKVAGSDGKIKISWSLPEQSSFKGVKIEIYSNKNELIKTVNLNSPITSYEYECENYVPVIFKIFTLELKAPEDGEYSNETKYAMAGENCYFVSSEGKSTNDGRTLDSTLDTINSAYKKISSINNGVNDYHIVLLNQTNDTSALSSNSLYNFSTTKTLNLVIETFSTEKIRIPARSGGRAFLVGSNVNLTCKNVIISGGNTTNLENSSFQGGGFLVKGKLTLIDCTVSSNKIDSYTYKTTSRTSGGGIYIEEGANCELFNTDILNNECYSSANEATPYSYGGGVCNAGTFVMHGGKFSGNKARVASGSNYYGHGIYTSPKASTTLDADVINEDDN